MGEIKAGRKIGVKVKMNKVGITHYPQLTGIGTILGKEILKKGDGLYPLAYRDTPYRVSYWVEFPDDLPDRKVFIGAEYIQSA